MTQVSLLLISIGGEQPYYTVYLENLMRIKFGELMALTLKLVDLINFGRLHLFCKH